MIEFIELVINNKQKVILNFKHCELKMQIRVSKFLEFYNIFICLVRNSF